VHDDLGKIPGKPVETVKGGRRTRTGNTYRGGTATPPALRKERTTTRKAWCGPLPANERVEILVAEPLEDPEVGFGLQQAVLEEVGAGKRGPTALIWTSSRYIGATRQETRLPNFTAATVAASRLGFPVLVRNSGGGAVAANRGSLSFSLTFPVEDLRHGLYERYSGGLDLISSALGRVGVEAEGGEVEGEFCPGAYSVRSGGPLGVKHAGLAQRVTRRAARLEALVLVSQTDEVRAVLERFYGLLGLPFRPESVGDLPVDVTRVIQALSEEVRSRYEVSEGRIEEKLTDRALALRGDWRVVPDSGTSL
jgi:octanoyl-[GcvH]:protein N-octanoyltransferase